MLTPTKKENMCWTSLEHKRSTSELMVAPQQDRAA